MAQSSPSLLALQATPAAALLPTLPTAAESSIATQALAAISASGGLSGMLPASTRVMRSPTAGISALRASPLVPLPGTPGGATSLMGNEPVSLPSLPGSVSGATVVSSPLGTGVVSAVTPIVPATPRNTPLPLPPSPTRRSATPVLGSTGSVALPTLPVLPPASPLPYLAAASPVGVASPLSYPSYTTPSPLPLPASFSPLPASFSPLPLPASAIGTPSLPLALPLGTVNSSLAQSGGVTTFPLTGGVSPMVAAASGLALPLPARVGSALPPPTPASSPASSPFLAAETAPTDAAVLLGLGTPRTVTNVSPVLTSASASPRALIATPVTTVTPLPPASRAFNSYAAGIKENSIDDLLISKGYLRLDTISLDIEKDKAMYIKAINPVGDIVFIHADKSGGLSVQLANRTVVKISDGTSIPRSVKIRAEQCANSAACGIAFQCEGDYCFVNRNNKGEMLEGTFITSETASDKKITPYGSYVAYPVITLSEIESNNDDAIVRVRKATMEIQREARAHSATILNDASGKGGLIPSVRLLDERLRFLQARYNDMHTFREVEVKRALGLIDQYRRMPQPLSAENQAKYKMVVDKLYNLNLTFVQLVSFMGEYAQTQKAIDDLIVKANDSINNLYWEARRTYDDEVSKALRDATAWGLPAQLNSIPWPQFQAGEWTGVPETPAVSGLRRLVKV